MSSKAVDELNDQLMQLDRRTIYELHDQLMQLDRRIAFSEEDLEYVQGLMDRGEDTRLRCVFAPYSGTSRMVHIPIPVELAIEFIKDQIEADKEERTDIRTDLIEKLQSLIDNEEAD